MEYLLCYDIVDDDLRQRVAETCMNNGLVRIQYSVFFGEISRNKAESTLMQIKDQIKDKEAIILLIELCERCAKKKKIVISKDKSSSTVQNSKSDSQSPQEQSNKTKVKEKDKKNQGSDSSESHSNAKSVKKRKKARISIERLKDYEKKGVIIL